MTAISQFNAKASLTAKRQAEARAAWTSAAGKMLVVGAYYRHRKAGWPRRVLRIEGRDIHWIDERGPGECLRTTFVHAVTGPL
jgi:hypothetical protein